MIKYPDMRVGTLDNTPVLFHLETICCDVCQQPLKGGVYYEGYSQILPPLQTVICLSCESEHKPSNIAYGLLSRRVVVIGYVPKKSYVYIPQPPSLVSSRRGDVFSLALANDGSRVVNNTVHASSGDAPRIAANDVLRITEGKRDES